MVTRDDRIPASEKSAATAAGGSPVRVIDSAALFDGGNEVRVVHRGQEYRLRVTRQGKLILTK